MATGNFGRGEIYDDPQEQDRIEAEALYELLENDVIPTFYDRGADNLPRHWIARMKASIAHLCHFFNTNRMVREYTERFYLPATARFQRLNNDNLSCARDLAEWKSRVEQQWPVVRVESVTADSLDHLQVNSEIDVRARVKLGLLISSDVTVELYFGSINARNEIIDGQAIQMKPIVEKESDGCYFEACLVPCRKSGLNGFTIRVLPHHADLVTPYLPGLITWANAD